jgi:hypothetical protein
MATVRSHGWTDGWTADGVVQCTLADEPVGGWGGTSVGLSLMAALSGVWCVACGGGVCVDDRWTAVGLAFALSGWIGQLLQVGGPSLGLGGRRCARVTDDAGGRWCLCRPCTCPAKCVPEILRRH